MYHVIDEPHRRCSKCGSIDRFFNRLTPQGYSYIQCADCGHDNAPIVSLTTSGGSDWVAYRAADRPKIQEY